MIFQSIDRFKSIGIALSLISVLVVFQIIRIQNDPKVSALRDTMEMTRNYDTRLVQPERGNIYDRWGHLLAGNQQVYDIGVAIDQVDDPDTVSMVLAGLLNRDQTEIKNAITTEEVEDDGKIFKTGPSANANSNKYITIASNVSAEIISDLAEIIKNYEDAYKKNGGKGDNLNGVYYMGLLQRTYPENTLAANILGYFPFKSPIMLVEIDGEEKKVEATGEGGIEEKYDEILRGTPVLQVIPIDPKEIETIPAVPPGDSLVLTIDREIQAMVERILDEAKESSGSDSGTVIVMDPNTGEILAMASTPRLNLNEYWEAGDIFKDKTPYNRAVSQTYEPGSVFKVLTMAAGIDSGAVTPDTTMTDYGTITIGGHTIYNWDDIGHGEVSMTTCMQKSLNVCLVWVAQQMGNKTFYDYIKAFGIGHRTNIDLSDEQIFPLALPGDTNDEGEPIWWDVSLGTNSFGQGISATPIQMITAISAVANEGNMMAPHLVRAVIRDGKQYDIRPMITGTPISAETARTLTNMLEYSLKEESSAALVEGYSVAGKTGTGEVPTENGYSLAATNASFVGWGPVDDPQFIVYVWLEQPSTSPWGSVVAAPVFSDIVKELVVLLNLPPDEVRLQIR